GQPPRPAHRTGERLDHLLVPGRVPALLSQLLHPGGAGQTEQLPRLVRPQVQVGGQVPGPPSGTERVLLRPGGSQRPGECLHLHTCPHVPSLAQGPVRWVCEDERSPLHARHPPAGRRGNASPRGAREPTPSCPPPPHAPRCPTPCPAVLCAAPCCSSGAACAPSRARSRSRSVPPCSTAWAWSPRAGCSARSPTPWWYRRSRARGCPGRRSTWPGWRWWASACSLRS